MEKKLHQIGWQRGQTDGDQIEGSVGLMKNIRTESFGRLGPRPALLHGQMMFSGGIEHVRVKGDPMKSGATHWDFFFGQGNFRARSSSGDASEIVYPGGASIDVEASSFAASDFGVVCSLWADQNTFLGIYFIRASKTTAGVGRLPTAFSFEESPLAIPGSASGDDMEWTISKPSDVRPELAVFYKELSGPAGELGEMTDGQRATADALADGDTQDVEPNTNVHKWNQARSEAAGYVGNDHNRIAVVATKRVDPGGLYGKGFTVVLVAQFVYDDGSVSLPSDEVTVAASSEWPLDSMSVAGQRFSLGLSMFKNMNSDPSVKEVRIYRKIVDPGSDETAASDAYDLVLSAPTYEDDDDPLTRSVSPAVEVVPIRGQDGGSTLYQKHINRMFVPYGIFSNSLANGWLVYEVYLFEEYAKAVRDANLTKHCRGWARIYGDHQVCQYFDEHYYSEGAFGIRTGGPAAQGLDDLTFNYGVSNAQLIHCSKTGGNLGTVVFGGYQWFGVNIPRDVLLYLNIEREMALGIRGAGQTFAWESLNQNPNHLLYMGGAITHHDGTWYCDVEGDDISASASAEYLGGESGYSPPALFTMDQGFRRLETLSSALGADKEDVIHPSARAIARIGGRIFGMNVAYGDTTYQSRLLYTPQRSSLFSELNYFDYSRASEGAGLGVLAWNSFLCCFFEDSVGVMDISGGSDFTYREAAYTEGVGPFSRKATCATPAGVFWAGEHIHIFNGKQIANVSEMPSSGVSIVNTYRAMVTDESRVRINYYEHDEEVWVSHGNKVLVMNIRTMAWRYYELDELDESDNIASLQSDNTGDWIFVDTVDGIRRLSLDSNHDSGVSFEWGVEFDAGLMVPEVVKKSKRLYVTLAPGDGANLEIVASGDYNQLIERTIEANDGPGLEGGETERISTSMRGRMPKFSVMVTGASTCQTRIDSIGLSYKMKNIK